VSPGADTIAAVSAPLLIVIASFLFATMGVCVKLASPLYSAGEIVMYRGVVGLLMMWSLARWRGIGLRTTVPAMHFWRSLTGATALSCWFYAIGQLPLATGITLNYTSSVWMALFLMGGAVLLGAARVDGRLVATVLIGFVGVALILRPTIERDQLWPGLVGLASGMLAAMAYLQVTALGRLGEPEVRIVFYFSIGGIAAGLLTTLAAGSWHAHEAWGVFLLAAIGVLATVAQLMMTRAYGTGRPLVNASLQYLGIAFSFAYGVLLFDDALRPMAVLGAALIVVSGIAATRLRQRSTPRDTEHTTLET
jgi:S-adenosylmethionine uptake transporter